MHELVWPQQWLKTSSKFAVDLFARQSLRAASTWATCLVIGLCILSGSLSAAEPAAAPKQRILRDWIARQHSLRSVKFVLKGHALNLRRPSDGGDDANKASKRDQKWDRDETVYLDLESGKIRRESHFFEFARGVEPQPRYTVIIYNGAELKIYYPPEENPVAKESRFVHLVLADRIQTGPNMINLDVLPVFWSVGIFDSDQLLKPHFAQDFGDTDFEYVVVPLTKKSAPNAKDGEVQEQLRRSSKTFAMRWAINPDKNSAVTGFSSRVIGARFLIGNSFGVGVTSDRHDEHGWFPTQWQVYGRGRALEYELVDIAFNPELPASLFELPAGFLKPGMIVSEKRELKTVAPDGHSLVSLPDEAGNGS
jgi:hypothetical protein